jgi:dTDP-4-amino-4,6-dideoxygalactose transaminase
MMSIPLVDLSIQHQEIEAEVRAGFDALMKSGAYILGPPVAEFESAYAEYSEVTHCVGVANGTDALELALRALDIGPGDEVVLPANTFIASALAVVRAGAEPVLVDSDPDSHLIDVEAVAGRIDARTRAVMAVDLFGQVADMTALEKLCGDAGIVLVEDAAQSQGARQAGRRAGSFGAAAGTSFYPGKNLGAYGDAGAVLTTSDETAAKLRRLRNYGSEIKYEHPEVGFNSRLDSFQAVVLLAKLKRLDAWNEGRRAAAARYDTLLGKLPGVSLPTRVEGNEHVWHIYAVRVAERDRVLAALNEAGVGAGVHYPKPLHLQGAFAHLAEGEGSFPAAEAAAREMISLPLFPGISEAQQQMVRDALERAVGAGGA